MSWASRACWATRVAASRCAYDATHTPVAITITPAISSAGRRKRSGRSREGRRAITTLIGARVRGLNVHELPAVSLCNGVLKLKFRAPIARGQDRDVDPASQTQPSPMQNTLSDSRLDAGSRALLLLSLQHGISDEEVARSVGTNAEEIT